jgi:hypothetical protein
MHNIFIRKPKGRDHLEDRCRWGRIILEWILQTQGGKVLTAFIWLRIGSSGGLVTTVIILRDP